MCIAEQAGSTLNASSETTLMVSGGAASAPPNHNNNNNKPHRRPSHSPGGGDLDTLLADLSPLDEDESASLADEFPSLSPTLVESFDDKGFCEPYAGTVCAGIITANYSIYSTSPQQQALIEERLKTILPLLSGSGGGKLHGSGGGGGKQLSTKCSTFALPSLCLFAFPLCDAATKQPKQICRYDCKQLQHDICKNEYVNVKSLFDAKMSVDSFASSSSSSSSAPSGSNGFLLDCNQLPPSSDSPGDCLPIVSMTLDKLESQVMAAVNAADLIAASKSAPTPATNVNSDVSSVSLVQTALADKKIVGLLYILIPCVCVPLVLICLLLTFCICRQRSGGDVSGVVKAAAHRDDTPSTSASSSSSSSAAGGLPVKAQLVPFSSNNNTATSLAATSHNSATTSANNLNAHSRLRMSNVSLKKLAHHHQHQQQQQQQQQQQFQQQRFAGSSKSSVASSAQHHHQQQQQQQHPAMSNYDNHYSQFPNQQQQQQQQQQGYFSMPPPPPPMCNEPMPPPTHTSDYTASVKRLTPSNVRLVHELGKGRFGPIYLGEMLPSGSTAAAAASRVVVKTLSNNAKSHQRLFATDELQLHQQVTSTPNVHNNMAGIVPSASAAEQTAAAHFAEQEFYNEISLYSTLRHKHIANLIGVHTSNNENGNNDDDGDDNNSLASATSMANDANGELMLTPSLSAQFMCFEHLNSGDLHEYLLARSASSQSSSAAFLLQQQQQQHLAHCGSTSNLSASGASSIGAASSSAAAAAYANMQQQQQRTVADFLYIGQQIAAGMEYLAAQNFVLRDLATRNVLMSDNLTVKISIDLVGACKEQYARDYYKFQSKPLPVRWMAPESLAYARHTHASDVWSYGVCLWEIFSYGAQPYAGCTNPEAIEMIRDRQLLVTPDECPQRAYALMLECWHADPAQRPTFAEILQRLRNWENYYLFNNVPVPQQQQPQQPPPQFQMPSAFPGLPPLPQAHHALGFPQPPAPMTMTCGSYSSKTASSLLLTGATASTGASSSSSSTSHSALPMPPSSMPPTLQMFANQQQQQQQQPPNAYFSSPSKANVFASKFQHAGVLSSPPPAMHRQQQQQNQQQQQQQQLQQRNLYREMEATGSLRLGQRQYTNNPLPSTFTQQQQMQQQQPTPTHTFGSHMIMQSHDQQYQQQQHYDL